MLSYRDATPADRDWLYALKRATLRPYVEATWGRWDEADQRERFARGFRPEETRIVQLDGQPVGALRVRESDGRVFLADVAVTPERQRRGLGRAIIRGVLDQAAAGGRAVRLQVLKVNPAHELYARLGFATIEETATHFVMEHPAPVVP